MLLSRWTMLALGVLVPALGTGQDFPTRPVRIVTSEAGGGSDFAARLIAQGLSTSMPQQAIVDNRGPLAPESVAKAPADGYTLLVFSNPLWLSPFLRENVPWDPVRDFAPVTLAVSAPNILVVHPTLGAASVKELIALAKSKPGELNYASAQPGSLGHLSAELFKAMAAVNIVRVPYKGNGPALNAVLGAQVPMMFAPSGSVAVHVKSGKLRALAITSAQPSALFPNLPPIAASGLPGYEAVSPYGVFAPAKTPSSLINRLNQEIVSVLIKAEVKERFLNAGVDTVASSPAQLAATLTAEMAKWGKLIKDVGIREE